MKIPLLTYIAGASGFLPVIAALYRNRSLTAELRLLLIMFSIGALNSTVEFILAFMGFHNLFLAHIFLLIEFFFFVRVFSLWFGQSSRVVLNAVLVLFLLFWVISHLTVETFTESAHYTSLVSKILLFGIALVFLHRISSDAEQSILSDSRFWILAGVLIYASGGLLFASLRPVIDRLPLDGLTAAYSVHWLIDTITNAVYTVAFLCRPRSSGGQLELAP